MPRGRIGGNNNPRGINQYTGGGSSAKGIVGSKPKAAQIRTTKNMINKSKAAKGIGFAGRPQVAKSQPARNSAGKGNFPAGRGRTITSFSQMGNAGSTSQRTGPSGSGGGRGTMVKATTMKPNRPRVPVGGSQRGLSRWNSSQDMPNR